MTSRLISSSHAYFKIEWMIVLLRDETQERISLFSEESKHSKRRILMNDTTIVKVEAYISGIFGPNYAVFFDFETGKVSYQVQKNASAEVEVYVSNFNKEKCLQNLQRVKLLEWQRRYESPQMLDGTQWYVKVTFEHPDMLFESSGSNSYPNQWTEFCTMVSKTVHKSFQ